MSLYWKHFSVKGLLTQNNWQIILLFQILCVNLHYHLKFNPINLI